MKLYITQWLCLACLLACSAGSLAQTTPQFIARRDIQLTGEIIAEAGDLVNVAAVTDDQVTLTLTDGKHAQVKRADLADMDAAVEVLSTLIQEKPSDIRLYSARANVFAIRQEFPKAIADATRAIELSDSKQAFLFVNRGVFHSSNGQHDLAVADYIKATHLDSSAYGAYTNLASAHIARKEFQKAIDVCSSVIKVDRDNAAHYIQRGVAERHLEDWDAAIADFSKALEIDKDNLAALGSRGFVNYLKGNHADAAKDFDAIIKLTPEDAMAYNNRGYNRFLNGEHKAALTDYNKAVALLPRYATAWQNKAWLLATSPDDEVRDGKAAIAAAKKAAGERQSLFAADIKALAAGYAETGDFKSAVKHQTRVIDLVEEDQKEAERKILATYADQKPFRTARIESD